VGKTANLKQEKLHCRNEWHRRKILVVNPKILIIIWFGYVEVFFAKERNTPCHSFFADSEQRVNSRYG
jgi:hypothetical protein